MDYTANFTITKALTQVIFHVEVTRPANNILGHTIVWQYTELFPEEAHPEPEKWAVAHMMMWLEHRH